MDQARKTGAEHGAGEAPRTAKVLDIGFTDGCGMFGERQLGHLGISSKYQEKFYQWRRAKLLQTSARNGVFEVINSSKSSSMEINITHLIERADSVRSVDFSIPIATVK